MGTKERRDRERDEMQSRILNAARELFAKQGYDAVSMRKIAEAIEYSPTAIYVHFKDKAELMRELCVRDFAAMQERNREVFAIADPVERIRRLGLGYIHFAVANPNHFRLMFMTKPSPEMTNLSEAELIELGKNDPNRNGYALLVQCVQEAIAQSRLLPHLRDPQMVAQLLWAGVHGVASLHITRPEKEKWCKWSGADVLGREMVDLILRGVLREGEAVPGESRRALRKGEAVPREGKPVLRRRKQQKGGGQ
jgi:AcrR family transcriptional regulator